MIDASKLVLGVAMRVPEPTIICYPNRMRDPRGAKIWDTTMKRLEGLKRKARATSGSQPQERAVGAVQCESDGRTDDETKELVTSGTKLV
jgi:hypothetical protein